MKQNAQTAAFFDLDDTIIVGVNTFYLYVKYMVRRKMMSRFQILKGLWLSALHKINLVNIEKLLDDFVLSYRGKSEQELVDLTSDWFASHVVPHIAGEARERIRWHKSKNHLTVLLSSATQYVCNPVTEHLGLDHTINSRVEVKDGRFTGHLLKPICYHRGKVHHTQEFAKKRNIDLAQSYFYTDSISDLPMLEIIGHPVIVNPDPLLARAAKKRGWPVELWNTQNFSN